MPVTKPISGLANVKQLTGADSPQNPGSLVTYTYGPVTSTAGQTQINLGFSVSTSNTSNFFLWVDGKLMSLGSGNDYTFTNTQANGTSSQITMTQPLAANLNINAVYLGVLIPNAASTSILTLNATTSSLSNYVGTKFRNEVINGNFDFWQRVETATTTVNTTATTSGYTADMFGYNSGGSTNKNYSIVQSSDVPTVAQSGFASQLSYLFTMVTGISSFAAGDSVEACIYRMEGVDFQRIHQKSITITFWFKASVSGTYSLALRNAAATRSYVTTFSVPSANTWQFVSVPITLDVAGTWTFSNSAALLVDIATVTGSTFQTSTLGSWQTGNFTNASTGTNWMATTGATIKIAQVGLTEGNGFGATDFIRAGFIYQQELAMCQRYYEKSYDQGTALGTVTTNGATDVFSTPSQSLRSTAFLKTNKRNSAYTVTVYNPSTGATGTWHGADGSAISGSALSSGMSSFVLQNTVAATANTDYSIHWGVEAGL